MTLLTKKFIGNVDDKVVNNRWMEKYVGNVHIKLVYYLPTEVATLTTN